MLKSCVSFLKSLHNCWRLFIYILKSSRQAWSPPKPWQRNDCLWCKVIIIWWNQNVLWKKKKKFKLVYIIDIVTWRPSKKERNNARNIFVFMPSLGRDCFFSELVYLSLNCVFFALHSITISYLRYTKTIYIVREGSTVYLECRVSARPQTDTIIWTKDVSSLSIFVIIILFYNPLLWTIIKGH